MTKTITLREANQAFARCIREFEAGEDYLITRSGAAGGRAAYWDVLLLATAAGGGCRAVLTEDMADGTTVEGVRVVNPFGGDGQLTTAAGEILGLGT